MTDQTITLDQALESHPASNEPGVLTGFANMTGFSDKSVSGTSVSFDHEGGITSIAADGLFADQSVVNNVSVENGIDVVASAAKFDTSTPAANNDTYEIAQLG